MDKKIWWILGIVLIVICTGAIIYTAVSAQHQAQPVAITSDPSQTNIPSTTTAAHSSSPDIFTLAQVSQHNSAQSCYTTISGSVYDLTSFINQHPGGSQDILSLCGVDGTSVFIQQHGGQGRPEAELATFKIGTLES